MDKEIEKAVSFLTSLLEKGIDADSALKYSQAAINIANAGLVLKKSELQMKIE